MVGFLSELISEISNGWHQRFVALSDYPRRRSAAGLGPADERRPEEGAHQSLAGEPCFLFASHRPARGDLVLPSAPLPTAEGIGTMPWWAPLGGVIGAFAVIAGLLFVEKVGAGAFVGLTITANILMSLVIDHFGLFGVQQHSLGPGRAVGAVLMVAGVFAISKF
jgi:hypothetical protein